MYCIYGDNANGLQHYKSLICAMFLFLILFLKSEPSNPHLYTHSHLISREKLIYLYIYGYILTHYPMFHFIHKKSKNKMISPN